LQIFIKLRIKDNETQNNSADIDKTDRMSERSFMGIETQT